MVKFKQTGATYSWELDKESRLILVQSVIPALLFGYDCKLHSVNGDDCSSIGAEPEISCHKIATLYGALENRKNLSFDATILGGRCTVVVNPLILGKYTLKIQPEEDCKYEDEIVAYINNIFGVINWKIER